jgi:hypothetical protein
MLYMALSLRRFGGWLDGVCDRRSTAACADRGVGVDPFSAERAYTEDSGGTGLPRFSIYRACGHGCLAMAINCANSAVFRMLANS